MPAAEILGTLRTAQRRECWLRCGTRASWAALVTVVLVGAVLLADRYLLLPGVLRVLLSTLTLATILGLLAWTLAAWLRQPSLLAIARRLETLDPKWAEALVSATAIALEPRDPRHSPLLLEKLSQSAATRLSTLDLRRAFDAGPCRRALLAAALGWMVLTLAAWTHREPTSQLLARLLHPRSDLPRPSSTLLEVKPGSLWIARGSDLVLKIKCVRGGHTAIQLAVSNAETGSSVETLQVMEGNTTRAFTAVRRDFEYWIFAGDFCSPVYSVRVREPPRPTQYQLTIHPPAYAKRTAETVVSPTGDLVALAGSRIEIEATASEALARAALVLPDGTTHSAVGITGNVARFERVEVIKPGSYWLQLESLDGVSNGKGLEQAIRPIADRPPTVEILEPRTAEVLVEESSSVELRLDVRDDVEVTALELGVWRGDQAPEWTALDPTSRSIRIGARILKASPGSATRVLFKARDALHQQGQSTERTIRISLLPDPPEGAKWPEPLRQLAMELGLALADWAKLLPSVGGETPGELAADPAHVEMLQRASSNTLGTVGHLRRLAESAVAVGRAIAVPSPNLGALEGLNRKLLAVTEEDSAAFWAEVSLLTGSIRKAVETTQQPVNCARLYALHRAAGATLDEALTQARALLSSEELENLHERSVLLELSALSPMESGKEAPANRGRSLAGQATLLAAAMTRAAPHLAAAGDLAANSRELVEIVAPALERGDPEIAGTITALRARLLGRLEREEALAAQVRAHLSPPPDAALALGALARSTDADGFLAAAQRAVRLLATELELVESREYADLETTTDLTLMREMVERIAEARLDQATQSEASTNDEASDVEALYLASRPSRALGRVIQALDKAATGQDDVVFRLRSASSWNIGSLRQLARIEREIRRLVTTLQMDLKALASTLEAPHAASGPLTAALETLASALSSLGETEVELAPEGSRAHNLAGAQATAGRAGSLLADLPERLEELRPLLAPQAQALRERLKARLGTLAQRVARLAAAERALAARIHELALNATSTDSRTRVEALAAAQEETRDEVERTAFKMRPEGDRKHDGTRLVERLRLYDRAAAELAQIAVDALPAVSRALRAASAQGATARSGTLIDAADKATQAADRIDIIAQTLLAMESEDSLQDLSSELDEALRAADSLTAKPEAPPDLASLARDARTCLEATLKAAEKLAAQAANETRKQPLLKLLRAAAELFRQAVNLAEANDAPGSQEALRAGRARLEEAVALAEKLRGDARKEVVDNQSKIGPEADDKALAGKTNELSRDLEAAYSELEKILEIERLEREIAARMDELLREGSTDRSQLEELEKKERDLEEGLAEKYLTTAELVELVSRLVTIDRDGREIASGERTLAADATRTLEDKQAALENFTALKNRQAEALDRTRQAAKAFQGAGFKLSAILPLVLKAYWQAGEALEPALRAVELAGEQIRPDGKPQAALLDAAEKIETWLARVGEVRHQALEAIADQERGGPGANAAQSSIERARRNLAEASRLAREGQSDGAQRLRKQSIRSIADAASSLRSRIADLALPGGEEGLLMSRLLDAEAARLGLSWNVATRGGSLAGAARLSQSGAADMPFPAHFRDWVKVYLQALQEHSP